jgi:hypothetical protein
VVEGLNYQALNRYDAKNAEEEKSKWIDRIDRIRKEPNSEALETRSSREVPHLRSWFSSFLCRLGGKAIGRGGR